MSDDDIRDFLDSLDRCEEAMKQYDAFKERQSRFTNEMIETITARTVQHFTTKTAYPHLDFHGELDEDALSQGILADKDFKFYGIWIFEEVEDIVVDFCGDEIPAGRKLYYKKIEYPSYSEESIAEEMKEFENNWRGELSPKQRAILYQSLVDDYRTDEFYRDFKISLHKALKKLTFEYYPEIAEISGAGIREIDSLLHTYMLMIRENVMNILGDAVQVSVKVTSPKALP